MPSGKELDMLMNIVRRMLVVLSCAAASIIAQEVFALEVVACEPEWASLVKEIGGASVEVRSATSARQDAHHIEPRPGLTAMLRNADLLICTGFGVEDDWLPVLLSTSANAKIQQGQLGNFEVAQYVQKRQAAPLGDYAQPNLRQHKSYRVYADPRNVLLLADALTKRLVELEPQLATQFVSRSRNFKERWSEAIGRWERQAAPLRGLAVVQHHNAWTYLCDWLGMDIVATLEPVQGQGTTSRHLDALLATLKIKPAALILSGPYDDSPDAKSLAKLANIPLVQLPVTVGSTKEAKDLFGLFDESISLLLAAARP